MLKDREHIDDFFADYLGEYEEQAPSYIWNNVQAGVSKKRRLKRYSRIRAIAASVALLVTFGLGYYSSDMALRKKYEAQFLNSKPNEELSTSKNMLSEDSLNFKESDSVLMTEEGAQKGKTDNKNSLAEEKNENRGILYKIFDLSKDIFSESSEQELNTNQLAQKSDEVQENTTNQLLIDTLLIKKGNLPDGGFLLNSKKKTSKWSFGTKFSPVYAMAENTGSGSVEQQSTALKSARNNQKPNTKAKEKSLMTYSGGLNVNYHLSKRWSLESGLFYSQRKQQADNLVGSAMTGYDDEMVVYTPEGAKFIQPEFNNMAEGPEVIGTARDETYYSLDMDYVSNFEYIELPILVRYKIVDRKVGLDVMSGVSTNFLIGNKTSIVQEEGKLWSGETEDAEPMLYNATIGLGLNYNFYRNFSFNLEPTVKYSIAPSESSVMAKYPYSFAVFAGFSYRFK